MGRGTVLLAKLEGRRPLEDAGIGGCIIKVKFALEEAMKAERGRRGTALLFL
jgi:hypothetical protein